MKPLCLDIETDGDRLVSIAWCWDGGKPAAQETVPDEVAKALLDPEQVVITHTKYDLRWLALHGYPNVCQLHDTQVMAWLCNENLPSFSLEALAQRWLGVEMDKRIEKSGKAFRCDDGSVVPWSEAPILQVLAYNLRDVQTTLELYHTLKVVLQREGLADHFIDVEAPFTRVLLDMELNGLPVDLFLTGVLAKRFEGYRDSLAAHLTAKLPSAFNIRSPQQLSKFLGSEKFTVKGRVPRDEAREDEKLLQKLAGLDTPSGDWTTLPPGEFVTTKEGRLYDHGFWVAGGLGPKGYFDHDYGKVDKTTLTLDPTFGNSAWVQDYLTFKKYDKLLSTYLEVFPKVAKYGRIYARFNQTGTVTGRLSSSDPNLQNIPARSPEGQAIRGLFRGNLLVGDFSQLEPRLMAHFSQDPELLRVFQQSIDLYTHVATLVGCDRPTAKVLVLAMGYGAGAQKLQQTLAMSGIHLSLNQVRHFLQELKREFSTYFQWREERIRESQRTGQVTTLDGRKRRIETNAFSWRGQQQGRSDRQAANAIIQGSAADVVRRVMLYTSKMYPNLKMLAQVHDELVWEYDPSNPPDLGRLQQWVESFAGRGLTVPLVFEPHFGKSWKEAKQ